MSRTVSKEILKMVSVATAASRSSSEPIVNDDMLDSIPADLKSVSAEDAFVFEINKECFKVGCGGNGTELV